MESKSQKYHLFLAEYFNSKENFLESIEKQRSRVKRYPPSNRPVNIRKVAELPRQYLKSKQLEKVEALLLNLFFLEAKAEAEMVFDLLVDLKFALLEPPSNKSKNRILRLIELGIRRNLNFISSHPTGLFQCLWNNCWWSDCPEVSNHVTSANTPMNASEMNLSYLMEYWRRQKEEATPGFIWVRALRPPKISLGEPLDAIFTSNGIEFTSVDITHDGTRVALGGRDGIIRVWIVATGILLPVCDYNKQMDRQYFLNRPRLEGGGAEVLYGMLDQINYATGGSSNQLSTRVRERMGLTIESIAFFPDGVRMVSGTWDATVRIWDTSTGEEIRCFHGHKNHAIKVAVSPTGKYIASIALGEDEVFLWNISETKPNQKIKISNSTGCSISFAPDREIVAVGCSDGTLRLWNLDNGSELCKLKDHNNKITAITFSGLGGSVFTGSDNGTLNIWDIETQKLVNSVQAHNDSITALVFCKSQGIIVSGSWDRKVLLWDMQLTTQLGSLQSNGQVLGIVTSGNGHQLVTLAELGGARIWSIGGDGINYRLKGHLEEITAICITSDEKIIVTSSKDFTIREWNPDNGLENEIKYMNESGVEKLIITPDDAKLICQLDSGNIVVWDRIQHRIQTSISAQNRSLSDFTVSPDSHILATGSKDGTIIIWDIETGLEITRARKTESCVFCLVFFPNNINRIVVGWLDGGLAIFDVMRKTWFQLLPHHTAKGHSFEYLLARDPSAIAGGAAIATIAVSPDGDRIVSGGYDNTVRFWDSRIGIETANGQHYSTVFKVVVSKDGNQVATWSRDNEVRIWDIRSGRCLKTFDGATDLLVAATNAGICPYRAVQWAEETEIQSHNNGTVLGWFEQSVYDLRALQLGRIWIGCDRDTYLYMFKIENRLEESPSLY